MLRAVCRALPPQSEPRLVFERADEEEEGTWAAATRNLLEELDLPEFEPADEGDSQDEGDAQEPDEPTFGPATREEKADLREYRRW